MISIDDGYTVPVGNLSPVASLGTPRQPPSVQTGKPGAAVRVKIPELVISLIFSAVGMPTSET